MYAIRSYYAPTGKPGTLAANQDTKVVPGGRAEAKAENGSGARHQANQLRQITIDNRQRTGGVNARLGGSVGSQAAVQVEVVRRDVQHDGGGSRYRRTAFQLEAGQLQHVMAGSRIEELERRRAEVPADCRTRAGA